jgi:type II secretory pathway pseudopilin PulG
MDTAMMSIRGEPFANRESRGQLGFSLLEALFAAVVMTIALVALLAVFAVAVSSTQTVQQDQLARQKAREALESIFTARQTAQVSFTAIANTPGGIFVQGMQPLTDPGPDGLDGTGDDVPAAPIPLPGPDGILGTADDSSVPLNVFQRRIDITNVLNPDGTVNPNVKQVTVTIQYPSGTGLQRTYTVQALISSFR